MYDFKDLDDYFNGSLNEFDTGCFSIAVSNAGKIVYDFYKSDVSNPIYKNFNNCTNINLGTVSKIYTGILVVKLIEAGLITADDLVKKYIPEFQYDNVRIIHLLTDTSGIKDSGKIDLEKISSQKQLFDTIYTEEKQSITPGNKVVDYTYGYSVLTDLIQRVTKQDINQFASDVIFEPLNLRRTSYNAQNLDINNIIMPCDYKNGIIYDYSKVPSVGNTGIYSVVVELMALGNLFLDFYNGRKTNILSSAGFKYVLTPVYYDSEKKYPRSPVFLNRGMTDIYSCFGDLSSPNTFGIFGDNGSMLSVDLDNDIAIAVVSNCFNIEKTIYKKIINRVMSDF